MALDEEPKRNGRTSFCIESLLSDSRASSQGSISPGSEPPPPAAFQPQSAFQPPIYKKQSSLQQLQLEWLATTRMLYAAPRLHLPGITGKKISQPLKQLLKLLNMKGKVSLTSALRGVGLKNLAVEIRRWKGRRALGGHYWILMTLCKKLLSQIRPEEVLDELSRECVVSKDTLLGEGEKEQ
ncbi:unnamed protein product [Nezara viridula]|uniref:Uncharacterized protein n=1 Tax=Nezara viridula TaxID=85310 RepID=A0A9P0HLD9_NEZVI|nr:unnamed protein product [Nezara viridula]